MELVEIQQIWINAIFCNCGWRVELIELVNRLQNRKIRNLKK
jgi:hypothetical protein